MSDIEIVQAAETDLPAVLALANSMVLEEKSSAERAEQEGFLVSGFTLADYQGFLAAADYFYVAREQGRIAGFLLAYKSESIKPAEKVNSLLKENLVAPFVLIKQICVCAEATGQGVATRLYRFLFDQEQQRGFAAAVVTEPFNARSVHFHERMGFRHLCNMAAPPDPDGISRPRGIWYRGPSHSVNELPAMRISLPNREADLTHQLEKLHASIALYTHEDNLNWTKFGMLITFMMALFAAFTYLLERPAGLERSSLTLITVTFGYLINLMFYLKLKSGLMYMNSHKERVKACERKILWLNPNLSATVNIDNGKIAGTSATSSLMAWAPIISLVLWTGCSLILLGKNIGGF